MKPKIKNVNIATNFSKIKKSEGITLVALVITIILLLILAGITISQLNKTGIFEKAKQAKEETEISEIIENARIDILGVQATSNGEITQNELDEILQKYGGISGEGEDKIIKTPKGFVIKVIDIYDGTITSETPSNVIQIYIDSENGDDLSGKGTKSNPYKTLEKILENELIQNDKNYEIFLNEGNYNLTSDMFYLNCNQKINFIGRCEKTILKIEPIGDGYSPVGNAKYEMNFYKMIWSAEQSSINYINTTNDMNLYNIVFNVSGTHNHGFIAPRESANVTINNCLLTSNVPAFIRTSMTEGYVRVTNSYGGFNSGYETSQSNWDYATNYVTSNILIDSNYRITDNEINWKNIGTGEDLDGTKADLGVYGGKYSW